MIGECDDSPRVVDAIQQAISQHRQLSIVGSGSKNHYVRSSSGDALQCRDHVGVIAYQPDELTLSVRAGTPLSDIFTILDERDQMLACDPPQFGGSGTIGGAVACGLNGPGRPWYGSIRDAVLGIEMVNGRGERLEFGGTVMKNVAGFDVSRLMAGSLGVFGVILTVNLRVHPKPEVERTFQLEVPWADAWQTMRDAISKPSPITGTCFFTDSLWMRLSGSHASVDDAASRLTDANEVDNACWAQLRDHRHHFFHTSGELRRTWLDRGEEPPKATSAGQLVEWAGAQIWSFGRIARQCIKHRERPK